MGRPVTVMREIFVESEYPEFKCPPGFSAGDGEVSVGEPLQGGRSRAKPLYMHRLLAPEELTQAALFVYRHWKGRRGYPDPCDPSSPLGCSPRVARTKTSVPFRCRRGRSWSPATSWLRRNCAARPSPRSRTALLEAARGFSIARSLSSQASWSYSSASRSGSVTKRVD